MSTEPVAWLVEQLFKEPTEHWRSYLVYLSEGDADHMVEYAAWWAGKGMNPKRVLRKRALTLIDDAPIDRGEATE